MGCSLPGVACAPELIASVSVHKIFTKLTLWHLVMKGGAHRAPHFPELMGDKEAFSVVLTGGRRLCCPLLVVNGYFRQSNGSACAACIE